MEKSSPSRTMGVVIREVELGGEKYTLSQPDKVRKAADEEAVVLSRRLDMLSALAKACEALPPESQQAWRRDYINAMIVGIATPEEWDVYFRSLWRLAFRFWCALDPKHTTGRTLLEGVAWCYELVNNNRNRPGELDSLSMAIRIVSQEDILGEPSGSSDSINLPTGTQSTEVGQRS